MRMSILGLFVVAALAPAGAVSGRVGGPAPESGPEEPAGPALRLTLAEAIRLGLERNPALQARAAGARAAEAGTREAAAARWPRLLAETGWHRTDHQVLVFGDKLTAAAFTAADFAIDSLNDPDAVSHASAAVALEVPLFTSGRIAAGIEAARERAAASRAALAAARAGLRLAITEAYHGVALARSAAELVEASLQSARGHEAAALARFEAGNALKTDPLRARVERLARERDLEQARARLVLARSRLRTILGLGPGEIVEPADPLQEPRDAAGDLDGWIGAAEDARPEIDAARRAAAAARAEARASRAALGPEAVGTARYERHASGLESGDGSFYLGVGVRWSAFDRARGARIAAAAERAAVAAAGRRSVEDEVRLEVEAAWLDARVADRNLAAAREAVAAAGEARRIGVERYAAGLFPLTDLLDTETALLAARLAEVEAVYDAVLARARLARAAGRLEAAP